MLDNTRPLPVNQNPSTDSGLEVHPIGSLETIGIIVGTNIGAGVLGIAFAARKTGYLPLLACLILTCVICIITMLYTAEACLRTRGNHQLSGLAQRYLGGIGAWLIFIAVAANSYGALTAYMSGSGNILADFFNEYGLSPQLGSLLFFIPSALILYLGLKALGAGQKLISGAMMTIVLVLIFATISHPSSNVAYLLQREWEYVIPVFNLAVFVFGAQFLVPELVRGNQHQARQLPRLIVAGMLATLLLVAAIPASVIALVGNDNVSQVATLNWGRALGNWAYYTANIFALLAMMTSYWGLGGCLLTNIFDHFRLGPEGHPVKRCLVLAAVALPPFLFAYSGASSFVGALYFAGTFGGVLMGIMPIILLNRARRHGETVPAFRCGWYAHPLIQALIAATFAGSGLYAIAAAMGWLPASW
ncbi:MULTISPECIES: aromatic amino acid transport family protein [Chromobacterium]|uniref:aromatic amino acid transport family protein n=1 Tax=Chromobacterium TaxID=535 RepID=UPI000D31E8FB|nr:MULTISPECIES: amino acid permease [Chromobacterium]PTU66128.1 amino acid permease [Chromobacterium sp. Panama]